MYEGKNMGTSTGRGNGMLQAGGGMEEEEKEEEGKTGT